MLASEASWRRRPRSEGTSLYRPGGSLGVCLFNFIGTIPVNLEHCLSESLFPIPSRIRYNKEGFLDPIMNSATIAHRLLFVQLEKIF